MGSGKTTAVIDYINQSSHPILIIVERQTEVDRLAKYCPSLVSLSEVCEDTGESRTDALERHVMEGFTPISRTF
ncbi:MAG: hypothetical protein OQK51_06720 [Kangiellaceae bacterium]|nr:hypothetical protein [Kangiellaceae bacterium]